MKKLLSLLLAAAVLASMIVLPVSAAPDNTPEEREFYEFILALDALEASLVGDNKTIILDKDSPLAQILLGK